MKFLLAGLLALLLGILPVQAAPAPPLQGQVLESLDGGTYTYLRLKTAGGETWAAVNRSAVKPGQFVAIADPMVMKNFESKALKRRFDKIVFGTLAGPSAANPHDPAQMPPGITGGPMPPHGMDGKAAHEAVGVPKGPEIAVVKVPKATGPDARTVAEVHAQKAALKNRTVAVHAAVVKSLPNIMGRNWLHVQDGSGIASAGTNDLVVTTKANASVGDVVTIRGVVRTDADVGMGMTYALLVEDAAVEK